MGSELCQVTFRYPGSVPGPVALVASFNRWDPRTHPLRRIDGEWLIGVFLPPGTYPYAFVIDGQVARDPSGKTLHGPLGQRYSILTVANELDPVRPRTPLSSSGRTPE